MGLFLSESLQQLRDVLGNQIVTTIFRNLSIIPYNSHLISASAGMTIGHKNLSFRRKPESSIGFAKNYDEFLIERRRLLAKKANFFVKI